MTWDFKNNPLLRVILVVVIGIFAFGLLFNSFRGGAETMDHMGNMGSMGNMSANGGYGYSLEGLISGLLFLLVKILLILVIGAVLVGVFIWIRNNFFKNTNFNFAQSIKKDPVLKTISVVTLTIIGIILIFALLGSFNQTGMGFSGHAGNYSFGFGYNATNSISVLLNLLVKVLTFVLVVSLILAAVAYLKNQYDQGNLNFLGTDKNQGTGSNAAGETSNQQPADNTASVNTAGDEEK